MVKFEDALAIVQEAILAKEGENAKALNGIELAIIEGVCEEKTYREIADSYHCRCQHVNNEAARLWRRIREAFGEGVTANNFVSVVEMRLPQKQAVAEKKSSPLAQRMKALFEALDFKFENHEEWKENYFEWVIKVPMDGKFISTLVRGIEGEVGINDIRSSCQSIHQQHKKRGWLVTTKRISNAAQEEIKEIKKDSSLEILCLTFDMLLDKFINFDEYSNWLETEVKRQNIDRVYVPLACKKDEFSPGNKQKIGVSYYSKNDGWIDRYVNQWLDDPAKSHLSVLGEFGTGKTWFALHYAWTCLQRYGDEKLKGFERPRFPLVINLRDYNKDRNNKVDVKEILETFLGSKHNINSSLKVFELLNRMGKLLLIFDGFDEMATEVDRQEMMNNFWELATVIVPGAKVILTCRTEHFPDAKEGRALLSAELTREAPQFEVLELEKLNDEQIRQVLSFRTNSATVEVVTGDRQLLDLARRPVMAEYILEALPYLEADIAAGKSVDMSRVYLYAVRQKMERDIKAERTFTSLADKLYFLCELSWEMLSTDQMSLNYQVFPDRIRRLFGEAVQKKKDLDHWHYDMMGQTMLIRNDDGDYTPAHRSLLEFFVAYKFAAELGVLADDFTDVAQGEVVNGIGKDYTWSSYFRRNGQSLPLKRFISESLENLRETFGRSQLTKAVIDLLLPMIDKGRKNCIIQIIEMTKGKGEVEVNYVGGNAITLAVNLHKSILEGKNFTSTVIKGANFKNSSLRNVNFANSHISNCQFIESSGNTLSVAFSPDKTLLATGNTDGYICLWQLSGKKHVHILGKHADMVFTVIFNPQGNLLASSSYDLTIRIWDISNGQCIRILPGQQSHSKSIAFSPDGLQIVSGSDDNTVKIWDIQTGKVIYNFYRYKIRVDSIAFSPDGKFIAAGGKDRTIKLWHINEDENLIANLIGHNDEISGIIFVNNSKNLISSSRDKTIILWDIETGKKLKILKAHNDLINSIDFTSKRKILVSGSADNTVKLWSFPELECLKFLNFNAHDEWVSSVAFCSQGDLVASSSYDQSIKIWDVNTGECLQTIQGWKNSIHSLAFSPTGKTLVSGHHNHVIHVWDINSQQVSSILDGHNGTVNSLVYNSDGSMLVSCGSDRKIICWNIIDETEIQTFCDHQSWVTSVTFNPQNTLLATSSSDQTIKIWNLETGQCINTLNGHISWIGDVAFSPNGTMLASCGADTTVKLWNTSTGECLKTLTEHENYINSVCFSRDGKLLISASADKTIRLWNVNTGRCLRILGNHTNSIEQITLSPRVSASQTLLTTSF
jgi:predicted NACHT family NTPase